MSAKPVLLVCLAAAFTTLLDQSSLNTAVPALGSTLGAGPATVSWIIAGYSLTFGLALIPAGRLGDAYGRKWLFVGGVALFTASAVVAATTEHGWVVAVARLFQGVGAGTVNPQVLGLIQEHFSGRDRVRALGAYATVGGVSGVIGPVVGGGVLDLVGPAHGWRYVLLLNLPFGLLTVPAAIKWLPTGTKRARLALDPVGLGLLAVTALGLLLPFVLPAGQGPPWPVWVAALPVALVAFVAWERRYRGTPILLPELVRSRGFVLGTLVATFQFGSSLAASLALTLYLQDGLGWTPLHAALTTLPSAFGFAFASAVSWRVVGRYGRRSVVAALLVSLAALLLTVGILHWAPVALLGVGLTVTQLVQGLASGLIISPNQALTLHWAPPGSAGLAAGFLQLAQRISATVSTAAVAGVVLGALSRAGVVTALAICAAQVAVAAALAALDLRPQPAPELVPATR